jgi:hypothetical protein
VSVILIIVVRFTDPVVWTNSTWTLSDTLGTIVKLVAVDTPGFECSSGNNMVAFSTVGLIGTLSAGKKPGLFPKFAATLTTTHF